MRAKAFTALIILAFPALAAAQPASGEPARVVAYEIVDARAIPASLTGAPGDPEAGRDVYFNEKLARCASCHGAPEGDAGPGEAGPAAPSLADVGRRLDQGAIRLWLVAPEVIEPGTAMPGYYSLGQRDDPEDPRFGEPLLTAAEIEHLVAYLANQTGSD